MMPVLDVNIALLISLRALIGSGQVVMAGDVNLTAGDVVSISYITNGFSQNITLGSGVSPPCAWSVFSLF